MAIYAKPVFVLVIGANVRRTSPNCHPYRRRILKHPEHDLQEAVWTEGLSPAPLGAPPMQIHPLQFVGWDGHSGISAIAAPAPALVVSQ